MSPSPITPASEQHGPTISVLLGCDDAYAPYAGVTAASVIKHASDENRYEIWVLESGLSEANKDGFRALAAGRANISVNFLDARPRMAEAGDLYTSRHISTATYYRLFAATLFPQHDKMLYLDSDLVAATDVAELFNIDLEDAALAACREPGIFSHHKKHRAYARFMAEELKVDPGDYFNAGVILMNLKAFRARGLEGKLLAAIARFEKPAFHDQDVLNAVCAGQVLWLDMAWNFNPGWSAEKVAVTEHEFSAALYQDLAAARANPKIIHYAGPEKPWHSLTREFDRAFWDIAKITPWHEVIKERVMLYQARQIDILRLLPQYGKCLKKRWRYGLLSKLCWGKTAKRYQKKLELINSIIAKVESL